MAALQHAGAVAPGPVALGSDEALAGGTAQGLRDGTNYGTDCHAGRAAGQALRVIEGERRASEYLARLRAEHADPDELALILGGLYGAALHGFCRVIAKALGVRHG